MLHMTVLETRKREEMQTQADNPLFLT